jgi:transmembrane sensor
VSDPSLSAEAREKMAQAAALWFARSRSGAFSRADRQALQAWLGESAAHRQAYIEIIDLWNDAEGLRGSPEVLSMREAALRRYPALARRRFPPMAAACAVLVCAAALGVGAYVTLVSSRPVIQVFQTGVGQTATIALIDGSRLTLDTDTTVRTAIGPHRRDIRLERGRAFFKVAHDASRPFVVAAAGKTVTATGTAFEVTAEPKHFEVLLVEGHVRVSQAVAKAGVGPEGAMSADLDPGARLIGTEGGKWILTRSTGPGDLAWMDGELVFDNKPLGEIAREMNRYSRRKIVVADPSVASRTVYGAFMAGDVDQFAHALADYKIARIQSQTETEIVLSAP